MDFANLRVLWKKRMGKGKKVCMKYDTGSLFWWKTKVLPLCKGCRRRGDSTLAPPGSAVRRIPRAKPVCMRGRLTSQRKGAPRGEECGECAFCAERLCRSDVFMFFLIVSMDFPGEKVSMMLNKVPNVCKSFLFVYFCRTNRSGVHCMPVMKP